MRGNSEVRFALVFTGFCRCRTLCAWSVRRIEKLRKNSRLELQNQGSGRPRGAQRSKFERKNGQLARKYTLEVPSGLSKNLKSARTRALRASKSAPQAAKARRRPKAPKCCSVISRWIFRKIFEKFGWGALPPRPPGFWLGGGKAPPDPPLKRSFATFDRGGQTGPPRSNDFFFGAADDTRAADDRLPAVRRPSTGRPTTVHGTNDPTVSSFSA